MPDHKKERHPTDKAAEEQGENERIRDPELLHGRVHIPQQSQVKLRYHEKPQSHHSQKVVLQIRLVPKK